MLRTLMTSLALTLLLVGATRAADDSTAADAKVVAANPSAVPPSPSQQGGGFFGIYDRYTMAPPVPSGDMMADAIKWCPRHTEPDRCRSWVVYGFMEHETCLKNPEHYGTCRYALATMHSN